MNQVVVCKQFEIAYAHNLPEYNGKCCNVHGHTGIIEVELSGVSSTHEPGKAPVRDPHIYPGMTVDFYDIKRHIQPIIDKLDHKNLNEVLNGDLRKDFDLFLFTICEDPRVIERPDGTKIIPPTSENIVYWLRFMIARTWPEAQVSRIRFWESPTSFAEWRK